jgi:MFS family permease
MQFIVIILRLVHIVAGAFWVGSALLLALYILPGVRRAGREGGRVLPMAQVSRAMSIASLLTTVAGLLLFGWLSRFAWGWIISPLGLGLTIGSLAGLAAFLLGFLSTGPTAKKIGVLAGQMEAAGGPPGPEQVAEIQRLQAKLTRSSTWSTALATTALVFMSVARYL